MINNTLNDILKNIKKDFSIEFRNRSALNISMAFAAITTLAIGLTSGGTKFSPQVNSIILWIIIFFSAMNGLSHIFTREEEEGTALFLTLASSPETIFVSKLIFNIILFFLVQLIITPLYIFFIQISIESISLFILTIFTGGLAISSSTTILASMVSKAGGKGSLFTIISFPVLLPVLWISIETTTKSLSSNGAIDYGNIFFLLAFSGSIILISLLLFRFIWLEE